MSFKLKQFNKFWTIIDNIKIPWPNMKHKKWSKSLAFLFDFPCTLIGLNLWLTESNNYPFDSDTFYVFNMCDISLSKII